MTFGTDLQTYAKNERALREWSDLDELESTVADTIRTDPLDPVRGVIRRARGTIKQSRNMRHAMAEVPRLPSDVFPAEELTSFQDAFS